MNTGDDAFVNRMSHDTSRILGPSVAAVVPSFSAHKSNKCVICLFYAIVTTTWKPLRKRCNFIIIIIIFFHCHYRVWYTSPFFFFVLPKFDFVTHVTTTHNFILHTFRNFFSHFYKLFLNITYSFGAHGLEPHNCQP